MKTNTRTTPAICALALLIILAAAMVRGDEHQRGIVILVDTSNTYGETVGHSCTTFTLVVTETSDLAGYTVTLTSGTVRVDCGAWDTEFDIGEIREDQKGEASDE